MTLIFIEWLKYKSPFDYSKGLLMLSFKNQNLASYSLMIKLQRLVVLLQIQARCVVEWHLESLVGRKQGR